MEKPIIVAIDGYSGCGKSSTAKCVAKKLAYTYIDSGAMYRATTLSLLRANINIEDLPAIEALMQEIDIQFFIDESSQQQHTFLNGEDVEAEIRMMYISEKVSQVSSISVVRKALVKKQQLLGMQKAIVMDGRDIGTTVFPEAELKVFMQAEVAIRAKRRQAELQAQGQEVALQVIIDNLEGRDKLDTTRQESPLSKATDALILDTSFLSFEEQCSKIVTWAYQRMKN